MTKAYDQAAIEAVDKRIRATCHPRQADFVFDPGRRISALCGRGGGKTTGQLMRFLRRMVRTVDGACLFIAGTREAAERLIWRDLKLLLEKLRVRAHWSEAKLTCTLPNGATLRLFGCDDKRDINKLRGLTYHEVAVDEVASINAELLKELMVEVIGPRMVGAICLIGTPGKILEGRFYDSTRPGSPDHRAWADRDLPEYHGWDKWSSHAWDVMDGASFGIEHMQVFLAEAQLTKAREGWSDTNPYWLREYKGQWIADNTANVYIYRPHDDSGAEFNQWTPELHANGYAKLPEHLKDIGYGIAMDVGFKDAFAIEIFAFSYTDPARVLYHVGEVYRKRLYAREIAKLLIGENLSHDHYGGIVGSLGWPDVLVGDFAGAGHALLEELRNVYGITVTAADKSMRLKENTIELVNSDLYDGRIRIMKGSNLAHEMSTLQWVVDQHGKRLENKAQANHGCDCLAYLRNALASMLASVAPAPPASQPPPENDPDMSPPSSAAVQEFSAEREQAGFERGDW